MAKHRVFDVIVLTAPTDRARELFSHEVLALPDKERWVCVSDPAGIRIGSGGGTNATDLL